ncbi:MULTISPECIES: hypothetical protein [unclassified Lactobacillus]|uniref:hypothetical protein n=1 Tax=unclassified Lactobacillus TaxID=2620435 RepID=UPI000BEF0178|nr:MULTISPECIES: hypothetical protein [unclassified Lactobacillus]PEG87470.1 hypothetical protein CP365_02220 [Lactobacillus sp. UMNPBX14]PEH03019.1 hypothetical protein CP357_02220 [Lactobacillus sp. UMNPBX6]
MSNRFEINLKDTTVRKGQLSLISDSLIFIGFFIMGLVGFLVTFQARSFDKMLLLGVVAIIVKEILVNYNFGAHKPIRRKLRRVVMSAGLVRLKNSRTSSLLFDTREVLDAPRIVVTDTEKYTQIEVYANGCPNPDNIYRLQRRLTEEFHLPAELVDDYGHATYKIYKYKQAGRKLSNDDFR